MFKTCCSTRPLGRALELYSAPLEKAHTVTTFVTLRGQPPRHDTGRGVKYSKDTFQNVTQTTQTLTLLNMCNNQDHTSTTCFVTNSLTFSYSDIKFAKSPITKSLSPRPLPSPGSPCQQQKSNMKHMRKADVPLDWVCFCKRPDRKKRSSQPSH